MPALTDLKIVMIEDDEGHARLIQKNLRRAGIENEIVPFTTGAPALEYLLGPDGDGLANKERPHVVLLDLSLPDMNGAYILQTVKKNESLRRSPVFVLTTSDEKSQVDRCYSLGCSSYIVKPVDYEAFSQTIHDLGSLLKNIKISD